MPTDDYTILENPVLLIILAVLIIYLIHLIYKRIHTSPFNYPYLTTRFDVSGKKNPNIENLIDTYINENGIDSFVNHTKYVEQWIISCQFIINNSKLKKLRSQQYNLCLDDNHMFRFVMYRLQTKYKQNNYVKTPYKENVAVSQYNCDFSYIENRYNKLKGIGFECTLQEYNTKNQRKLMTKKLREQIAKRDNYTCQICGKYMPDGVGLHIDHIVPIAKGGKTVESNLQVLCSKCNGKKSSK